MITPIKNIGSGVRFNQNLYTNTNKRYECNLNKSYGVSFGAATNISRFSRVDELLYRGGKPNLEQIYSLRELGIGTIIDFSIELPKKGEVNEALTVKNLGMNYYKLPFFSSENPSEKDVKTFFEIIENCKKKNEKVFVHCQEGRDRTGLYVELYKIRYRLSDAQTSIDRLKQARYRFSDNPLAIPFIKEFAQTFSAK